MGREGHDLRGSDEKMKGGAEKKLKEEREREGSLFA